ncbi:MAG: DUF3352 domain-containing protein [Actinomycetota bacterium]|nr:DUF3352 domain-containing protein [Chloroflexota bacterium]
MRKQLAIVVAGVVVAGGAAAYVATRYTAAPDDEAIAYVPKDAAVYATVFIEPSRSQRSKIDSILKKVPKIDSLEEAKDELVSLLDPELEKIGLDYESDVEPWLGGQAAFFLLAPDESGQEEPEDGAALLATDDPDAANAAIDKALEHEGVTDRLEDATHEGVDYRIEPDEDTAFGFIGDFLVVGNETGFKAAVDASTGESLADNASFRAAIEPLADDQVALTYLDSERLIESFQTFGPGLPEANLQGLETFGATGQVAFGLHAEDEAVVFESSSQVPDEGPLAEVIEGYDDDGGIIGDLPGDAWLAASFQDSGSTLSSILEALSEVVPEFDRTQIESMFRAETGLDLNDDVLSWMGDAGFFLQGTNLQEIGGGLVIESSDADKTEAVVDKLESFVPTAGLQADPLERGGLTGFSVQGPGMPAPVNVLGGERLIAAYGDRATDAAIGTDARLRDSEAFGAASGGLGDGYSAVLYLEGEGLVEIIEAGMSFSGATDPTYEEEVKPYLDHLAYVVVGFKVDDDTLVQRFVVGAR